MQKLKTTQPCVVIIIGPTASGKTDVSYKLARHLDAEIINADIGQFYTPLTIGTAKPAWKKHLTKAHLFDIIDLPNDFTVHAYRALVTDTVNAIKNDHKVPLIVGGSLFYIKSLLFPTHKLPPISNVVEQISNIPDDQLWSYLHTIDTDRARHIHQNDVYRLKRALTIWFSTGCKPSGYQPQFDPPFPFFMVIIKPPKKVIDFRIRLRTEAMIQQGWIEEVKNLIGSKWEPFLKNKGLIGYCEILDWLKNPQACSLEELVQRIQQSTILYAKRQMTFISGLAKLLQDTQNKGKQLFELHFLQDGNDDLVDVIKGFESFKRNILVGKK